MSVARGSGGILSFRSTILAVKEVFAVVAPDTDTVMLTSWGVPGVCHLTHTTWESSSGITMLLTW